MEVGANYIDVDPNFNPGIGYVRAKERLIGVRGSIKPRPGRWKVRQLDLTPSSVSYHDADGALRSRDTEFHLCRPSTAATASSSCPPTATSASSAVPIGPGTVLGPGEPIGAP